MKDKIILPINKDPLIKTYTYYGFINAILSADYANDGNVAEIEISDWDRGDWKKVYDRLECRIEGNHLYFFAEPNYCDMNGCWYRPLYKDDEVCITIHSQLVTQPWGAINVFISNLNAEEIMEDDKYMFRLGRFNKEGIYTRVNNIQEKFLQIDYALPMSIALKRNKEKVTFRVKTIGGEWQEIGTTLIENNITEQLNIGFQIKLNDSAYLNWQYSNYIQLCLDIYNPYIKLQYYFGLKKNWQFYIDNYFINYRITKMQDLFEWKIDKLDYVRKCLNNGKYLETWLNFYYMKGRTEYGKKDEFHQYLVYGYSDITNELYVVGYNNNGKMLDDTIGYDDFLNERNVCKEYNFFIEYDKQIDGNTYEFNMAYIREMIKQYLQATNTSFYCSHIFPQDQLTYGIAVYDELVTERGLKALIYDRRITHLIYEHKECMKKRLEYMRSKGIWLCDDLFEQVDKLALDAKRLRNVSLKYAFGERTQEKYNDLKQRMSNLKTADKAFMEELLV